MSFSLKSLTELIAKADEKTLTSTLVAQFELLSAAKKTDAVTADDALTAVTAMVTALKTPDEEGKKFLSSLAEFSKTTVGDASAAVAASLRDAFEAAPGDYDLAVAEGKKRAVSADGGEKKRQKAEPEEEEEEEPEESELDEGAADESESFEFEEEEDEEEDFSDEED